MNYENLLVECENSVATIILNRPNVMNALNAQMRAELTDAVIRYSKEARVVVLTGAGNAFCSGQDLGDGNSLQSLDLERTLRDEYEPLIHSIVNSPVPTVTNYHRLNLGLSKMHYPHLSEQRHEPLLSIE